MVKLLYTDPVISVRTNNVSSELFSSLRQTTQLTGIFREGQEHRVYADDLLIYLFDSSHSLPSALNILETFGKLSAYKINLSKSAQFPVNEAERSSSFNTLTFKVTSKFTYLGINVPDKFSKLFLRELSSPHDRS